MEGARRSVLICSRGDKATKRDSSGARSIRGLFFSLAFRSLARANRGLQTEISLMACVDCPEKRIRRRNADAFSTLASALSDFIFDFFFFLLAPSTSTSLSTSLSSLSPYSPRRHLRRLLGQRHRDPLAGLDGLVRSPRLAVAVAVGSDVSLFLFFLSFFLSFFSFLFFAAAAATATVSAPSLFSALSLTLSLSPSLKNALFSFFGNRNLLE